MSENTSSPLKSRPPSLPRDEPAQSTGYGAADSAGPRLVCLLVGMLLGSLFMGMWWTLVSLVRRGA